MEIMGIICSPRKSGNTAVLINEAMKGAREFGYKTESIFIADMEIQPCDGCFSCRSTGKCKIKDDMHIVYDKMRKAKGIIFGTPVYVWSMTGQAKILMDRTIALRYPSLQLRGKVGGVITVGGRRGCIHTASIFNYYFLSNNMFATLPVDGYGEEKGSVRKDIHGMKSAFELGRLVGAMVQEGYSFPEEFDLPTYVFVGRKYGITHCPVGLNLPHK
jgi:multimeric flavodoxin WrbA